MTTERNGDADAAAALMRDMPEPTDDQYMRYDAEGNLVHVPHHIREARARVAAEELIKRTT